MPQSLRMVVLGTFSDLTGMVEVFIASERVKVSEQKYRGGEKLRKRWIKHHHSTEIVLYSAKMLRSLSPNVIIQRTLNGLTMITTVIYLFIYKFTVAQKKISQLKIQFPFYSTTSFTFLSKSRAAKIFFPSSLNSLTRGKFPTEPHERENENNKKFIRMSQYVASCLIRN